MAWGAKIQYRRAGTQELAAVTAKLDASEPDWRLDAVVAKYNASLPPPERNSALVVLRVYESLPKEWRKLAARVPRDPFDDKPLTIRPADGLEVCVRKNPPGGDRAAFRLWNPDRRGLPQP